MRVVLFRKAFSAFVAAILLFAPVAAKAAVSVTPTRIMLSKAQPTQLLTLTNQANDASRFQASVFAWRQTRDGKIKLDPTNDVVAFPPLFSIAGKDVRNIRVGMTGTQGVTEKDYRIIVQELPHAPKPGVPVEIQMLTRFSIPIFVAPVGAAVIDTHIEDAALAQGTLSFTVVNQGTLHTEISKLVATGTGADGTTFDVSTPGWYLLAGEHRVYHVQITSAMCRRTRKIAIQATTRQKTMTADITVPPQGCADATATKTKFLVVPIGTVASNK